MAGTITGKHVLWDVSLTVNGVDLSDHVERLELTVGANKHPGAAMGGHQDFSIPGTKTVSDISVTFFQDYASAKVYATLLTVFDATPVTTFNVVAKASSGATSATNPAWTIPVFVSEMPVMTGTRGDRHMAPVTLAPAGAYSIATA